MEFALQQSREAPAAAPAQPVAPAQPAVAPQQPVAPKALAVQQGQASGEASALFPHKPPIDISKLPETTGEKYFRRLRFGVAEGFILVTTAALAYISAYKPTLFGRENKLYSWSRALEERLDQPWINKRIAGAFSNTMMTFHGGNAFAPIMYWFDQSKEKIVTYFNQRFGTPEEVEIGKERLKDEPKPTLWTVIKGRIVAFAIVFSAFVGADFLLGKNKQGNYRFDAFTDRVGRVVGHWFDDAKPFFSKERLFNQGPGQVPFGAPGDKIPSAHKGFFESVSYLVGKILSLDIFAATASISIWTAWNEFEAALNAKKKASLPLVSPESEKPKSSEDALLEVAASRKIESGKLHAGAVPSRAEAGHANFIRNAPVEQSFVPTL